jgi:lysophospholipase L1-like esterase
MTRSLLQGAALLFFVSTSGALAEQEADAPRVLAIGDSLLAWNGLTGGSIPNAMSRALDFRVVDRSIVAAFMVPNGIPKQYVAGDWDWVVMNGGGNDLWLGCGCTKCETTLDRMLSPDGKTGLVAETVANVRKSGARVVYVGYLRSPGLGSPIEHCRDEGAELEKRISSLARRDKGVYFLSLDGLVPEGDRSYFAIDMIHPSRKASTEIGNRIADLIRREGLR